MWAAKGSCLTYAYAAVMRSEFTGLQLQQQDGAWVDGLTVLPGQINNGVCLCDVPWVMSHDP